MYWATLFYLKGHRVGQNIDSLYTFNEWLNDLAGTNDSPKGNATILKRDSSIVSCVNETCQYVDYHVDDEGVIAIDIAMYHIPVELDDNSANNTSYGLSISGTNMRHSVRRKFAV